MIKELPNVTLIAIAGNKQPQTIAALYKSLQQINPAKTVLITNIDITASGIECINVGGLKTWEEYNRFCIKELYKYFHTSHVLVCQWDGYVLDGEQWSDDFLLFDYIGAKWLDSGKPYNVGNGGFSLRSQRLQSILGADETVQIATPEDVSICKVYGEYLKEVYDINFAPEEIADKFSYELNPPLQPTFGFHAFHHEPYRETVVIKRSHALGDVIMVEPVLHYFHKKGYRVALDTSDYFMSFFNEHYFPVLHKNQLHPDLPYREIDLNMAYEVKPKQNHLQSYYDFSGVTYPIRNPILSLSFDYRNKENKLFPKYAVLHIDNRDEPHRNIYGVEWELVVKYLNEFGYTVIQLGKGESETVKGAVRMATPSAGMLMWVVASSDMFVGIDSGIAHIASGFSIPSVIFFGSVDPKVIYPNLADKEIIHLHNKKVCDKPFCWGDSIGQTGTKCYIDESKPPCTQFSTWECLGAIDNILEKKYKSKATLHIT